MADNKRAYEAMFLLSQGTAADLRGAIDHINELLTRCQAEVVAMKKWDERRLAYEIDKQKRGTYILAYFYAPTGMVQQLERDCNISEKIMRVLILSAEHLTEEEMRSTDARQELEVEARLRAERGSQEEQVRETVTIGAPQREEEEAPAADDVEEPSSEEN
ncbi:MAG: 30S ribosomal protein S6 [Phycisphaerales bacterium]|jgi:small subunit ribosomal protein S6|nr:30S ribosomal protein S6 [Phycisphaerales bacterium]